MMALSVPLAWQLIMGTLREVSLQCHYDTTTGERRPHSGNGYTPVN